MRFNMVLALARMSRPEFGASVCIEQDQFAAVIGNLLIQRGNNRPGADGKIHHRLKGENGAARRVFLHSHTGQSGVAGRASAMTIAGRH